MPTLRSFRLAAFPALAACLTLAACADVPTGARAAADLARLRVAASVAGTTITTLTVEVTAADIPSPPPLFNLPVQNDTAQGTIAVPAGLARTFTVRAYDASGEITHEGAKTLDVQRGANPPLTIALRARNGQLPVTVSFGTLRVVVTPAQLSLAPGESTRLSAVILDPDDHAVEGTVAWASSNPALATVDADGTVHAVRPGLVGIVATYGGVAGASTLTVTSAPAALRDAAAR